MMRGVRSVERVRWGLLPGGSTMNHVILFQHPHFRGRHRHYFKEVADLDAFSGAFANRASSIVVLEGNWEFYRDTDFRRAYPIRLGPGIYPDITASEIAMESDTISSVRPVDIATIVGSLDKGHVILFQHPNYQGLHWHVFESVPDLGHPSNAEQRVDNRVSSIAVLDGKWIPYRLANYAEEYVVEWPPPAPPQPVRLGPGLYPSVVSLGIKDDTISSLRNPDDVIPHQDFGPFRSGATSKGHAIIYKGRNFTGGHRHVLQPEIDLGTNNDGFDNNVESVVVVEGDWQLFRSRNYGGDPVEKSRGIYANLDESGLVDRMTSLRPL